MIRGTIFATSQEETKTNSYRTTFEIKIRF